MPAGFKTGHDNDVHARLLDRDGLIDSCRRSDRDDFLRAALFENFARRNSEDETEYWHARIEHGAALRFERRRRVRFVARMRRANLVKHRRDHVERSLKFFFAGRRAAESSMETHKFIANGLVVRARISETTRVI